MKLEANYDEVMAAVQRMPKEAADRLLRGLAKHKAAVNEYDSGLGVHIIEELETKALYYANKVLHSDASSEENIVCCPQCKIRVVNTDALQYQAYESAITAVASVIKSWYMKNVNIKKRAVKNTGG